MASGQRFSAEWSALIEGFAPSQYRAQRQDLYADLNRHLSPQGAEIVLLAIASAEWVAAMRRRYRDPELRPADDRYWSERRKIEAKLKWLQSHPLVRLESNLEVVFYEPHEVDCGHGRNRKTCILIGQKLRLRRLLQHAFESLPRTRTAGPLLRTWKRRLAEAHAELGVFGIDPATADASSFCLQDELGTTTEASESEASESDRVSATAGRPGAPPDDLQNFMLEVVGELLVANGRFSRKDACRLLANVLVYCFNRDREARIEDLAENLERQWRELRKRAAESEEDT